MTSATGIDGPLWSVPGLDVAAGRFPLSVERHVMRMVDLLVPGVTAVTPHARYYALHGLVADEVERRKLSSDAARTLLRRSEVALAAISWSHNPHLQEGLPRAHGVDALAARLSTGTLDVVDVAANGKTSYAQASWGFWNAYFGSELTLGVVEPGAVPTAGPALDRAAVRTSLGGLLEVAAEDSLRIEELAGLGDKLCVCAGPGQADADWLAGLLIPQEAVGQAGKSSAVTRRETVRLFLRAVQTHEISSFTVDLVPLFAYGAWLDVDPATSGLAVAPIWRGVVLRNESVTAWRRLWSWLVGQAQGLISVDDLGEAFAQQLPVGVTVQDLLSELPDTTAADGSPAPVETPMRMANEPLPLTELRVLAAGARRAEDLKGPVKDAFLGQRGVELGPEWMGRRLDEARPLPVRDFARQLAADLVARSQWIALRKARRRSDGSLWLPTRLHQRGEMLWATSQEGRGRVGLRLDQLGWVLAGAGLLAQQDGSWAVTPAGAAHV